MNKLVSVIIPTYKRPDTLDRAIESVMNQTYTPIEIIVVDDNNPDTEGRKLTEDCMKKYSENPNIKYVKHERNKNGSAARNTGAKVSKGAYLAFLDDDDEYYPGKIEAQVHRLEELDENWGACYTSYERRTEDKLISRSGEKREGNVYFHELCRNFWHGGGTGPLVRRSVYEAVGGFDESFLRNQDYEYMIKITKKYKLAYADVVGHIQYVDTFHEKQATRSQIWETFFSSFQKEIDSLPPEMRKKFDTMISLQKAKYALTREKNISKAMRILRKSGVGCVVLVRYVFYLLYRKLFKVCCGFNI